MIVSLVKIGAVKDILHVGEQMNSYPYISHLFDFGEIRHKECVQNAVEHL